MSFVFWFYWHSIRPAVLWKCWVSAIKDDQRAKILLLQSSKISLGTWPADQGKHRKWPYKRNDGAVVCFQVIVALWMDWCKRSSCADWSGQRLPAHFAERKNWNRHSERTKMDRRRSCLMSRRIGRTESSSGTRVVRNCVVHVNAPPSATPSPLAISLALDDDGDEDGDD